METFVISLTQEQIDFMEPLYRQLMNHKGALIGQVYGDGIRVKWLSPDESAAVQKALNTPVGYRSSAYEDSSPEWEE